MTAHRLDRDEVVAAALAMTRRDGLDALTMRGLAQELGVTTMATYHWVPSKQALVDLVLDTLLTRLREARPVAGSWSDQLRQMATDYLAMVRTYPGVERALRGGGTTEVEKAMLREARNMLRSQGFCEPTLSHAWDLYQSYMFGHFALESSRGRSRTRDTEAFLWGLDRVLMAMDSVRS